MTTHRPLLLLITLAALAAPTMSAQAATLSVEPPLAAAGSTILLPVVFSPGKDKVNVVEGSITIPDGITVDGIDTSGSAFSLFADGPIYMLSSRTIEFTAGAPGGLAPDSIALVFVIKAHADVEGKYDITPLGISSYENDGKGTRNPVSAPIASVSVGPKGSVAVDAFPPAAPAPLVAEIGNDESLFNGRWFATFYGGADSASIDHYEVREGWWRPSVRADRYYVLLDQDRSSTVWVTAVSENGKRVTSSIAAENPWTERAVAAVLILVLATVGGLIWRRFFRRIKPI